MKKIVIALSVLLAFQIGDIHALSYSNYNVARYGYNNGVNYGYNVARNYGYGAVSRNVVQSKPVQKGIISGAQSFLSETANSSQQNLSGIRRLVQNIGNTVQEFSQGVQDISNQTKNTITQIKTAENKTSPIFKRKHKKHYKTSESGVEQGLSAEELEAQVKKSEAKTQELIKQREQIRLQNAEKVRDLERQLAQARAQTQHQDQLMVSQIQVAQSEKNVAADMAKEVRAEEVRDKKLHAAAEKIRRNLVLKQQMEELRAQQASLKNQQVALSK